MTIGSAHIRPSVRHDHVGKRVKIVTRGEDKEDKGGA